MDRVLTVRFPLSVPLAADTGAFALTGRDAGLVVDQAPPFQLPAWVPSTVAEAGFVPMTNTLQSVQLFGVWSDPSNITTHFSNYSGGVYNKYYGPAGAHVIHGGGHAATNDNSVFLANYNTLQFERVGGPTQLGSSQAYEDAITSSDRCEVAAGVPGSAHTYDCLQIVPPALCGDSLGALIRPVAGAIGVQASRDTGWSHAFGFTNQAWSLWSTNKALSWTPGGTVAHDTTRQKMWPISGGFMANRGVLDLATRTWTNNSGGTPGIGGYPDNLVSAYHATRDIVVISSSPQTPVNAQFIWFSASGTGGERNYASFTEGAPPHVAGGGGILVYVPEMDKMVYWSRFDQDAYYEITVPANPAAAWSWVRRVITGAARPSLVTSPLYATNVYRRMDYSPQLKSLMWVTSSTNSALQFGGRVVCIRIVN